MPETSAEHAGQSAAPRSASDEPVRSAAVNPASEQGDRAFDLARAGWTLTTLACVIAAIVALLDGYNGYAAVAFAVAVSAGINLT